MTKTAKTIYLFRHGEVEAKYQKRFRGVIDCELSDEGKRMSEINAQFLIQQKVDFVLTTGLKRTDYVGQLVAAHGIPHELSPGFREASFGDWEGMNWEEATRANPAAVIQYHNDFENLRFPGGESIPEIQARLAEAWEALLKRNFTKAAVISHSTCNTALVARLQNKKFNDVVFQVIGSFHEFRCEASGLTLVRENVVLY